MAKKLRVRKLTDKFVRTVEPPGHGRLEFYDRDVPHLSLRVTSGGVRAYYLRAVWADGKDTRRKIGDAEKMSCAEARLIALKWLAMISQGVDPADVEARARIEIAKFGFVKKE